MEEYQFIVTFAQADNVSYDYSYFICKNELDSKELVNRLLAQAMEEYEYSEEEKEEILYEGSDCTYEDPEGEWFIRVENAKVYNGEENIW
jgi:hypothetical protein